MKNEIGTRLKEERLRLKFSQTEFAGIGGVQRDAQLRYEKGMRFPDAAYLSAIAKSGADVTYIITGRHATDMLNPKETTILESLRAASPKTLDVLSMVIEWSEKATELGQEKD